jgi:hypothetical protein
LQRNFFKPCRIFSVFRTAKIIKTKHLQTAAAKFIRIIDIFRYMETGVHNNQYFPDMAVTGAVVALKLKKPLQLTDITYNIFIFAG